MEQYFDLVYWSNIIEQYKEIGPIIGILLPLLESIIPFLPLVAFTTMNVAAFGYLMGYIYSLIGEILGSLIIFTFFRKYIRKWFVKETRNNKRINKAVDWLDNKGYRAMVLLISVPFTPSALINIAAGLSDISFQGFLFALLVGKAIMIFFLVYIGYNFVQLIESPKKLILSIVLLLIAWFLSKIIQKKVDI